MFSRASRLKQAALTYAAQGWPVAPAIDFTTTHWARALIHCTCRAGTACPAPGAHPASADWFQKATTDPDIVATWWTGNIDRNVLLATGIRFDAWLAPVQLGNVTADLLRRDIASVPVARTADDSWVFLTQPAGDGANLEHIGVDRLTTGDYLVAPPSWHGGSRRDRWLRPPATTLLPAWEPVAMVLLEAHRRVATETTAGAK